MPEYIKSSRPVEWEVTYRGDTKIAVVRVLRLGRSDDPYYRVVTWAPVSRDRKLIGYWGHLDEACQNAIAHHESTLGGSAFATGPNTFRDPVPSTPQKPPPGPPTAPMPNAGNVPWMNR